MAHTTLTIKGLYDKDRVETLVEAVLRTVPDHEVSVDITAPARFYRVEHDDHAENPREWDNDDVMFCQHRHYVLGDKDAADPYIEQRIYFLDDGSGADEESGNKYRLVSDEYGILPVSMDRVYDLLQLHAFGLKRQLEADPDNASLRADAERAMSAFDYVSCMYDWPDETEDVLRPDIAICLPIYMYDHSGLTVSHNPFGCRWDSGQLGWHYMTKDVLEQVFDGDIQHAEAYMDAQIKIYDDYLEGDVWMFVIEDEEGEDVFSCRGFYGDNAIKSMLACITPEHHEGLKQAWENRYDH